MRCEDLAEKVTDLLEGDLDEAVEAAAIEHLASCERCETVLAQTREVMDLARAHGRARVDPATRQRLLDAILSPPTAPRD